MEYKQFIIEAFQREPGLWRARVRRKSGRPLKASGRSKSKEFITESDAASADQALIAAMRVIDAGRFYRATARSTEKYWRRNSPNEQ